MPATGPVTPASVLAMTRLSLTPAPSLAGVAVTTRVTVRAVAAANPVFAVIAGGLLSEAQDIARPCITRRGDGADDSGTSGATSATRARSLRERPDPTCEAKR